MARRSVPRTRNRWRDATVKADLYSLALGGGRGGSRSGVRAASMPLICSMQRACPSVCTDSLSIVRSRCQTGGRLICQDYSRNWPAGQENNRMERCLDLMCPGRRRRAEQLQGGGRACAERAAFFVPRAAILALESGEDDGEEEPSLGPRLDGFEDYDEHRFIEECTRLGEKSGSGLRCWPGGLAGAGCLAVGLPVWGAVVSLPLFYLASRLWDTAMRIVALVREQRDIRCGPQLRTVDLAPQQIQGVNWWSLRQRRDSIARSRWTRTAIRPRAEGAAVAGAHKGHDLADPSDSQAPRRAGVATAARDSRGGVLPTDQELRRGPSSLRRS